jgi:hypothetical protein
LYGAAAAMFQPDADHCGHERAHTGRSRLEDDLALELPAGIFMTEELAAGHAALDDVAHRG